MDGYELGAIIAVNVYNFAVLAGCAFLVWNGWSPWWFALAVCCIKTIRTGKAAEL